MFKFLTAFPWTYYIIAALIITLFGSAYLLKNFVEKTGELSTQNAQLSADLQRSEADKENLLSTIQVNSQKSLEDQNERQILKDKVAKANDQISKLKRLTKDKGVTNGSSQNTDDPELSDDLVSVLKGSYCSVEPSLCANPGKLAN